MTRGAMKIRIAQLLGLAVGDNAYGDPFAMDNALNRVCDEFAGTGMWLYWASVTNDVASGTAEYPIDDMFKIKSVLWLDGSGNWTPLITTTSQKLDTSYPGWRNLASSATPVYASLEGPNYLVMVPKPNFTRSSALKVEGFAVPSVTSLNAWASDSSECPLPSWTHDAIAVGAAVDILLGMLASENAQEAGRAQRLLPGIEARYRMLRGQAQATSERYYFQGAMVP